MEKVSAVVRRTLDTLAAAVRPGVTTAELDAVARDVVVAHGARSAPALFYGFPATVLISVNDEIVHGIPGPRRLQRGDLVSLDVTVEKDGYIADAARSVVVGDAEAPAAQLVACAEAAFDAALDVARRNAGQRDRTCGAAGGAAVGILDRPRSDGSRRRPRHS